GNGNYVRAASFGGPKGDWATSVAVAPDGDVVVAGWFMDTIDLGGGPFESAYWDGFLARFGADGTHRWSKQLGGSGNDGPSRLAIDSAGNVLLTGIYDGTADFGGGPLAFSGLSDVFLAKYSKEGTHRWSKGFGQSGWNSGNGVAVDP